MSTVLADPKKKKLFIQWAVTILCSLAILLIPTGDVFTSDLRLFFAITVFFILLVCFGFFGMLLPSMLLFALYLVTGLADAATVYSSWSNTTVWMVVGTFAVAYGMEECGLLRRISMWIAIRCGGTYNGILYGMYILGLVVGALTFVNGFIIVLTFAFGLIRAFDFKPLSKEAGLLMFVSAIGGSYPASVVYCAPAIALLESGIQMATGTDFTIPWYMQTTVNWLMFLLPVVVIFIYTKIYKTKRFNDRINKQYFLDELKKLGKITKPEIKTAVIFILLMLYLLTQPLTGWPIAYGFMLIPWLLWAPGINVATTETLNRINFGVISFIAACLAIGTVGTSLGIGDFVVQTLGEPLSNLGVFGFLTATLGVGTIANLVMTPYAIFASLTAPLVSIGLPMGINPAAIAMTLLISSDIYFFPHEVTCLVVMFSFGMCTMGDFIKFATIKTVITFIFFMALVIPYWMLTGFTVM